MVATSCGQLAIPLDVWNLHYYIGLFTGVSDPAMSNKSREVSMKYDLKWELPTVMDKVFKKSQSIKEVIVINGKAVDAQMTTCAEYVNQRWKLAIPLLDALDVSKRGVQGFGKSPLRCQ